MTPQRKFVRPRRLQPTRDPLFRPAGLILAMISFLVAVSMLVVSSSIAQQIPASSSGAVLILHDAAQSAGQYRLMRTALAKAGLPSQTLQLLAAGSTALPDIQYELNRLAQDAQCTVSQIWLAASGTSADQAFRVAAELPDLAGLLLIAPVGLSELDAATAQKWPAGRSLQIITGSGPEGSANGKFASASAEQGRLLFESVTGEDAHLFSGDQVAGLGQPFQYMSVSGEIYLAIFPALPPDLALFSAYLLPVAARQIAALADQPADAPILAEQGRRTVNLMFLLILAGLFLLAVPFCLGQAVGRPNSGLGTTNETTADQGRKRPILSGLLSILLWLPSILLAAGLGWLANWLTVRLADGLAMPVSWLFFGVIILPGCRGWLFLLASHLHAHWLADGGSPASEPASAPPGGPLGAPQPAARYQTWLTGAILMITFTTAIVVWLASFFGTLLPAGWPWFILPLLILVNAPAGLAGSNAHAKADDDEPASSRDDRLGVVWQLLPFLVLPVLTAIAGGWAGLAGGVAALVVAAWAAASGRAITGISRQSLLGSLAHSVLFSLTILIPPIVTLI